MIISNLKLTFTLWGFSIATWSFSTFRLGITSIGYCLGLLALIIWPMFIMVFLELKQEKLEEEKFKNRHETLY